MISQFLMFSMIAVGAPTANVVQNTLPEVMPRSASEAKLVNAEIMDDDLKQAAEWMEKKAEASPNIAVSNPIPDSDMPAKVTEAAAAVEDNQIPVLSQPISKKAENSNGPIGKMLLSLAVVLGMVAGTFYAVKKWAKNSKSTPKTNQIRILTQHFIGPRKSLAIIRVAGESILIGVTDHNISLIKSLALMDEEIPTDTPNQFSNSLEKANAKQGKAEESDDEFSISKIKDFVNDRLKGMKEI